MGATPWPKRFWKYPAGLPQTPRQTPQDLRDSRKRQSISRETCGSTRKHQSISHETCGTPANTKAFPARLAGLPQTPKYFPRDLRDSRKHQSISRGTCTGGTSISKNTLLVTALYPSHSSGIRSLILLFKLTLQRFLEREIRRRRHPFRSDRSLGGHTLLRSISEVPI